LANPWKLIQDNNIAFILRFSYACEKKGGSLVMSKINVTGTETNKADTEIDSSGPNQGPKNILILGSGFGGTYALRRMLPSISRRENIKITMVSDENFFLFTPVLHMVAMGSIETRHVAYPIRRIHKKDQFEFIQSSIERINLKKREVITSHGGLNYDYLLLALGSVTHLPDFDVKEKTGDNFFTLKTLGDTVLIRNHIIDMFERASVENNLEKQRQLLTFVVAGAGYTGIQLITELRDFIRQTLVRFYKSLDPSRIRIILIETEPKIMAGAKEKLSNYISHYLERTGIEVRLNSRITRILNGQAEINKGELIDTGTILWVAGLCRIPKSPQLMHLKMISEGYW
jgi:NADH dehydrogenase